DCTLLQPLVQTLVARDIGIDIATLDGVINTQGTSASYFFEYGIAGLFGNSSAIMPINSDVGQEVTEQISGLVCGFTYDYRLVAEIEGVRLEGKTIVFTTLACPPDFSIAAPVVNSITQDSVDIEVLLTGSQDGDIVFFEYGLDPDFTDKSQELLVNGQTMLLDTLIGLQCESVYNVRAVLKRGVDSVVSDPISFTTDTCPGGAISRVVTGEVSGAGQTGVTFVGILNPSPLSAQVFFEYGVDIVDENRTRSQILSTVIDSINVRQFVAALTCDTIYQYRIAANVAGELIFGETKTFITNPCVVVNALLETLDPEIMSSTSVSFRAKVDPDGLPTSVYFEYGVDENLDMVTPQYSIGDGKMPRSFSWLVNGLLCGSTYQYRAMAVSTPIDGGEDVLHAGSILGFVTDACEAINIDRVNVWATKTSASIDVILNTYGESTEFVLSYGDTEEKIERSKSFTVSSGTVHLQLKDLQCGTIYYFSVIASNINGGIISDQDSFSTQDCALVPGVFSEPAIDITAKSASLIARVTPNGTATSAYFNYGVESQFDKSTLAEVVGVSFVDQFVSHSITGLLCETTYQYRIVASNEDGVSNGDALSFTTAACGSDELLSPRTESRLLDAGGGFSVVIGSQGSVIAWGDNSEGQLGVDASGINRFAGIKDETGNTVQNIIKVAAGQNHVLALIGNNKLLAWGDNKHGQLGNGENQSVATPLYVGNGSFGELFGVVDIGAGNNHSVAVMENGAVFTWGENKMGQLGIRSKQNSSSPVQVAGIENAKKTSVGANHNLVLLDDGRVLAWGANESGQLGDESTEAKLQPVEILFEQAVVAIYSGENFSFAQDDKGVIWAWGDNQFGQLGLGDRRARSKPTPLPLDVNVLEISAGKAHSIALIEDGTLLAWGDNSKGQLARSIEVTGASETPIPVWVEDGKVLVDIVAIAAGDRHSVALSDAGNLLAWGDGGLGQLGSQRDQSLSVVPVVVSDESGSPVSLKVPRIIVSTDTLSIIEGESSSFYIRLSSAPEVSVRVQYEIDGNTKFTLDEKSRISFDATNWDKDQEIIIQVEKDEDRLNDLATLV
ncbi:MAG: hypothetical protein OEX19_10185, partial [Gammaproteobacteria bacterium]|nr:hypothetical protein [Gammaproteobacteria bacterium]